MTHCHIGEFGRWRLAVQRAIFSLSAVNTIAINTIVTRLAAVALALCGKFRGCKAVLLLSARSSCGEQQVRGNSVPQRHQNNKSAELRRFQGGQVSLCFCFFFFTLASSPMFFICFGFTMASLKLGAPYFRVFPSFGFNFTGKASCTFLVSEGVFVPRLKMLGSDSSPFLIPCWCYNDLEC